MDSYFKHLDIRHFAVTLEQLEADSHVHAFEPVAIAEEEEGSFFKHAEGWQQSIVRNLSETPALKRVVQRFEKILNQQLIQEDQLLLDLLAVRYYRQVQGTEVPWHCDYEDSDTAINFLFGSNKQPFTFQDIGDVPYSCCFFNTSKFHMVKAAQHDRLMLRVTPRNIHYEELYQLMQHSGMFL